MHSSRNKELREAVSERAKKIWENPETKVGDPLIVSREEYTAMNWTQGGKNRLDGFYSLRVVIDE